MNMLTSPHNKYVTPKMLSIIQKAPLKRKSQIRRPPEGWKQNTNYPIVGKSPRKH